MGTSEIRISEKGGIQQLCGLLFLLTLMGREGKLRQKKSTLGEHLALLSVKYSMYPNEVFQALISARKNDKAVCGDLTVEYRGKVKNRTIFLITKDNHVVAQFRVDDEFLLRKDNPFESWMSTDKIRKKMAKQNTESIYTQINDLRAGMKRVNVKAAVLEMPKPAQVHTQFGNTVMVVNAVVRDETGKIRLCLWEGQIGSIGMGDNIELKNAQVCVFRGEKQLRLGKNGALTVLQSAAQHVKPQLATPSIR
jgi:replication factor A1